jgi:hypothetical protein
LSITGEPSALVLDFGDGMALEGSVDGMANLVAGGLGEWMEATLAVACTAVFTTEDERWVMDGTLEAEVDDDEFSTNNCTISGPVQAYQLDAEG